MSQIQTVGLEDIGSLTELVRIKVRGEEKQIEVGGVPAGDVFYLLRTFPEFKAVMERKLKDLTAERVMKMGSKFVGMVIAFASVEGDREDEKVMSRIKRAAVNAERFGVATQVKILNIVFKYTFADGVGPFVEELKVLKATFSGLKKDVSGRVTPSPTASRAGLQMDAQDKRRGPLRLDS